MQQDDTTGAAAATFYFLELYDYMRATGDTDQWVALTDSECDWCTRVREEVVDLYGSGGWIDAPRPGLTYDIAEARVEFPREDQPFYVARMPAVEEPFSQLNSDGTILQSDGSSFDPIAIGVQFQSGGGYRLMAVNYGET